MIDLFACVPNRRCLCCQHAGLSDLWLKQCHVNFKIQKIYWCAVLPSWPSQKRRKLKCDDKSHGCSKCRWSLKGCTPGHVYIWFDEVAQPFCVVYACAYVMLAYNYSRGGTMCIWLCKPACWLLLDSAFWIAGKLFHDPALISVHAAWML